jgi:hypothetical protein
MSDPVPAITKAVASGETGAIFADIRRVLGGDAVSLIWRHLATIDGALLWALWRQRLFYVDGLVRCEAMALHVELGWPPMTAIPAEVFAGMGLGPDDLNATLDILATYDHTNAMAMVALSALRARLDGHLQRDAQPAEPRPVPAAPRTKLQSLLDPTDIRAETSVLVMALNGLGTRRSGAVLASMYRHLAHWSSYLSFSWRVLPPLNADGRLATAIQKVRRAALVRADRLAVLLVGSAALPPLLTARICAAVEPFVGDAIVKMLVICAFLRRVTG